jgi:hypothetical protein
MRKLSVALILALTAGCTVRDANPDAKPAQEYPSWAFDAPFYYRPTVEPAPLEMIGPGIPVYYSKEDEFFVRHPAGSQVNGVPRVAVWTSLDAGMTWQRSGFFGVEQTHFVHKSGQDGAHWVRFVGPSQAIAQVPPAQPHRIYVVDRTPPEITVSLNPAPVSEDSRQPHTYYVGDEVVVSWQVVDENLQPESVRLSTAFAEFPNNVVWGQLPHSLPACGSETITLPVEAATEGGMRFRIVAVDKAGNTSIGMSDTLNVCIPEGKTFATTQPTGLVIHDERFEAGKPGWPLASVLFRGSTVRTIEWMPPTASDYRTLELQFSANSGLTWQTLVSGLSAGQVITWTVPAVNSPNCLIRLVGIDENGDRVMLATSRKFIVDTVVPDVRLGPEPIRSETIQPEK